MFNKLKTILAVFFLSILLLSMVSGAQAQTIEPDKTLDLYFFYSPSCPHCQAEQSFLDKFEIKYPQVNVERYQFDDPVGIKLMTQLLKKYSAEKYFGSTPLTFIGDEFMPGFDNDASAGQYIELSVVRQLNGIELEQPRPIQGNTQPADVKIDSPILKNLDTGKYSLPLLSVVLGLLDGFNVCSLGALVMILGMVLVLKSRKKIIIYGGIFILTTAIIYGLLIVLWYKFFSFFASYMIALQILLVVLGFAGAFYFFKEYLRFRKYGVTCEVDAGQKVTSKFSDKLKDKIQNPSSVLATVGLILLFSGIITIVEFPCSAVVPVAFAGILAQKGLSTAGYIFYIAIFVFFYMLDELIVFILAVFKMNVWLTSSKFTKWASLVEGIVLFLLGLYYLLALL